MFICAAYHPPVDEHERIDADRLAEAMRRANREQDDEGMDAIRRQISALQQNSGEGSRWGLRRRARDAWDPDDQQD